MRLLALALPAALTLVLGGCVHTRASSLQVPLEYTGSADVPDALKSVSVAKNRKVFVDMSADEAPQAIGENAQDSPIVPIYGVQGTPEGFVETAVQRELSRIGVAVSAAPEDANRVLELRLTRFFVREKEIYEAEVIVQAEVKTKSGKTLWTGAAAGTKKTWGRSLSADNYREVLSGATTDMIEHLFANPDAQAAIFGDAPLGPRETTP